MNAVTTKHVREIAERAAKTAGFALDTLTPPIRHKWLDRSRKIAMYLTRVKGGASLYETGYVFRRDHTCVARAVKWTEAEMLKDDLLRKKIKKFEAER